MNWKLIVKKKAAAVPAFNYDAWKELLSEEGHRQCVYCSLDENTGGGIKFFEIEHYKPESKFKALARDYDNLFYSCAICNGFKSNDWKEGDATDLNLVIYPKPSVTDYSVLFETKDNGLVTGKHTASKYLVTRLYLNRPQLIIYRKYLLSTNHYNDIKNVLSTQMDLLFDIVRKGDMSALDLIQEVKNKLEKIDKYKEQVLDKTRLYSLIQIRKQK